MFSKPHMLGREVKTGKIKKIYIYETPKGNNDSINMFQKYMFGDD